MNYKQKFAIRNKNKQVIREMCGATDDSGIYCFTRISEEGIKYAYVGQAKKLLDRIASHLDGYEQHIDRSLKKNKLYSTNNQTGWKVEVVLHCIQENLDEAEQTAILSYHKRGYQLLNKTSGSQSTGKSQIGEYQSRKGYRDGVKKGEDNARKFIKNLFDKHLVYSVRKEGNKNQEKAFKKLEDFLDGKAEK